MLRPEDPPTKITLRESLRLDMVERADQRCEALGEEELNDLEMSLNQLSVMLPDLDFDTEVKTRHQWHETLFPTRVVRLPHLEGEA